MSPLSEKMSQHMLPFLTSVWTVERSKYECNATELHLLNTVGKSPELSEVCRKLMHLGWVMKKQKLVCIIAVLGSICLYGPVSLFYMLPIF